MTAPVRLSTRVPPSTVTQFYYEGATDPALDLANNVQAGKVWRDSGSSPVLWKRRNTGNTAWVTMYEEGFAASLFVLTNLLGVNSGVATLDGGGKLLTAQLPALAINDVFTVASQAAMLALTAQRGDVALRTDTSQVFILSTDSPGTLADWKVWLYPAGAVTSVFGRTGAVVATASDYNFTDLAGALATSQAPSALKDGELAFFLQGNGSVLSTTNPAAVDFLRVPVACHLKGWHVFCDASGTLALDIQRTTYSAYSFATLGTTNPSLSSEIKKENTGLNVALAAGDLIRVVLTGTATTITSAAIFLDVTVD